MPPVFKGRARRNVNIDRVTCLINKKPRWECQHCKHRIVEMQVQRLGDDIAYIVPLSFAVGWLVDTDDETD